MIMIIINIKSSNNPSPPMIAKPTARPLPKLVLPAPVLQKKLPAGKAPGESQRRFASRILFGSTREVVIEHNGQEYRLRQTRQGKLILNK